VEVTSIPGTVAVRDSKGPDGPTLLSDAAIADPAYDFGLLHRDLGPTALDLALRGYGAGVHEADEIKARADFYARCSVLEDMAYGLQDGHAKYLDKCLPALNWLFPTGGGA